MKNIKYIGIALSFFITLGCTNKNYTLVQANEPVSKGEVLTTDSTGNSKILEDNTNAYANFEYKIQPHDRLAITAYKYPEITPMDVNSRGFLVDNRGYVNLPLVHRVKLSGLTQSQATRKLERLYSRYLRNPSFNVEVLNKRAYVLGEVNKPGVIDLDHENLTILEAIAHAGDLKDNAVRDEVIILSRNSNGRMSMRKVDLTNFSALNSSNILIKPNDIIYVQPDSFKKMRVNSQNIASILGTISAVATPYVTIKAITK